MFPLLSLEGVCGRRREETKSARGEATQAGAIWQMQHALEVLRICTEKKRIMIISDISERGRNSCIDHKCGQTKACNLCKQ